jgi:endonuclease/exonuclease/phosphatase family metal-dependent hydrolase
MVFLHHPLSLSERPSLTKRIPFPLPDIGDFSTASGSSGDGISKGNGTEVTKQEYIDVFKKVGADLWGLQEDSPYFNGTTKELPYDAIYHEIHPTYKREFSGTYNGKAFLSGYEIYDVKKINYAMGELNESQATGYGHPWFLTGKVMIEGKEVAIATLHFDWSCKEMRANQIEQVIAWAKQYEYAMIIGDVNPDDCIGIPSQKADGTWQNHTVLSSESTHLVDNKRFTDAGFVQANGGKFGTFYTIMKNGVPRSQSPCDNIFVSPNIEMVNAEVVYEPWMNDHAIVFADIKIK